MASRRQYAVIPILGLKPSDRRGIIFLIHKGDANLDAAKRFEALEKKQKRTLLDRFDLWIEGKARDNYFHGWPNLQAYKQCFVFKWRDRHGNHRLYGFLCHPQPNTRPRFQLCVLTSHAIKTQWETQPTELDNANTLRVSLEVMLAIRAFFPERQSGDTQ